MCLLLRLVSGCGGVITTVDGIVMSPGYGIANYPNYQICRWNITEPSGRSMRLTFEDFVMGDNKDFVEVCLSFRKKHLFNCLVLYLDSVTINFSHFSYTALRCCDH